MSFVILEVQEREAHQSGVHVGHRMVTKIERLSDGIGFARTAIAIEMIPLCSARDELGALSRKRLFLTLFDASQNWPLRTSLFVAPGLVERTSATLSPADCRNVVMAPRQRKWQ